MFKLNSSTQLSVFDETLYLSDYQRKLLDNNWPGYFRKNIFPKINEQNFKVLYSDKISRPNTPVNIMVSLLILKELTGLIDSELMQALIFDTRYQYALCTTSLEKQPISRNAFTNFRNHLIEYELNTGVDLYKEEIIRLSNEINNCCKKETTFKRMDSIMISSSCKSLSRIDLAYKVNINLIEKIKNFDNSLLSKREQEYLEPNFKKEAVYDTTKENQKDKLNILLDDSKMLYDKYKKNDDINQFKEFQLLERMVHDQLDDTTGTPKESKDIKPTSLQNPSDPDATYRFKYGNNIGYAANIVEELHENGEVYITGYDLKQNTYSDIEFMEDYINNKIDNKKETTLVDAAYFSNDINNKAKEKNIELVPTQTMGKKQVNNTVIANFEVDEETHQVLSCPNNEHPLESKYNDKKHVYLAKFDREKCMNCPFKEKCEKAKIIKKRISSVRFSEETYQKAKLEEKMNRKEYKEISNHRSGIEGTMSTLRRKYQIDKCPSKGLLRLKIKLGSSILSININKGIKYGKKELLTDTFLSIFKKLFHFFGIFNNNLFCN